MSPRRRTAGSRRWSARAGLLLLLPALYLAYSHPSQAFRRVTGRKHTRLAPHTLPQTGLPIVHWDLREFPDCRVPYCIGRTTRDLSPGDQSSAIVSAAHTWDDVLPAKVGLVLTGYEGPTPNAHALDGYNTIGWNDTMLADTVMGYIDPIPAITYLWFDETSGRMLEADIRLNNKFHWGAAQYDLDTLPYRPDPPHHTADVRTVVLHEFGHFFGLDHPEGDEFNEWDTNLFPFHGFPGPEDTDRNHDGYFTKSVMEVEWPNFARWHLSQDDWDGLNFLYNPDIGDAPDPVGGAAFNVYPSLVHDPVNITGYLNLRPRYRLPKGAEHLFGIRPRQRNRNYTYEWLGWPMGTDDLNGECESNQVDQDSMDDGVKLIPNPPVYHKPLRVVDWARYANDFAGHGHDYQNLGKLWVNTWIDMNADAIWQNSERVIQRGLQPAPLSGPNTTGVMAVDTTVTLPDELANATKPTWLRARIDWEEDCGTVIKHDYQTLTGPRGAAQFGEVEDYPLSLPKPTVHLTPANGSGHAAAGMAMVMPGAAAAESTSNRLSGGGGCPGGAGGAGGAGYDPLADETTQFFMAAGGIAPGEQIHVGVSRSAAPAQALRAYWLPQAGPPGIEDRIPTVNGEAFDLWTGSGARATRVLVGTVNDSAGGYISGDPLTSTWNDSMLVTVIARVAPAHIPLEHLNLCDPLLSPLSPMPLGSAWITPETPFQAELPAAMTGGSLVLEVHTSWSMNAVTCTELLEFDQVVNAVVAVPPLSGPGLAGLRLRATPTPTVGSVAVEFVLAAPGKASLRAYDSSGRVCRELLHEEAFAAGSARRSWDGRAADGHRLPAGIYFLKLEVGGRSETARVVLLK